MMMIDLCVQIWEDIHTTPKKSKSEKTTFGKVHKVNLVCEELNNICISFINAQIIICRIDAELLTGVTEEEGKGLSGRVLRGLSLLTPKAWVAFVT